MQRSLLIVAAVGLPAALAISSCNKSKTETQEQAQNENTAAQFPDWAEEAPAPQAKVDQTAVDAIKAMSKYLSSLPKAALTTEGTMDVVTADGQRIQMDGNTSYELGRPGFAIKYASDKKTRNFYYDGKQFTEYSPSLGYYSTVPAPATNREALDAIYNHYGIRLPLEDLFRWDDDANGSRIENFRAAYNLGTVTLDGVKTTHYAFREPDVDWEVWIDQGDKPLPRKLSIVDRTDPARPAFTTRLKWTANPSFSNSDFTFVPGPGAMKIPMAEYKG